MKKVLSAIILLCACILASAQNKKQLDSLAYILPEFDQGIVVYSDGNFNRGILNISPLDQVVCCISPENDTLFIADNYSIMKVHIGNRSFERWRDAFVETIISDEETGTGIGVTRATARINNVKTGAYGMVDHSSSIESYSYDNFSGNFSVNIIDDPLNFRYKEEPCLVKDGKYSAVTKKNFQKLFPSKKAYIESVWNTRKLIVSDTKDVVAFYKELLEK